MPDPEHPALCCAVLPRTAVLGCYLQTAISAMQSREQLLLRTVLACRGPDTHAACTRWLSLRGQLSLAHAVDQTLVEEAMPCVPCN